MTPNKYKVLYDAQKAEHEKTWEKLRAARAEVRRLEGNYQGALEDLNSLLTVVRKHAGAMQEYVDKNYRREL